MGPARYSSGGYATWHRRCSDLDVTEAAIIRYILFIKFYVLHIRYASFLVKVYFLWFESLYWLHDTIRYLVAGALIVSTPQDVALMDARRGVKMFSKVSVPV